VHYVYLIESPAFAGERYVGLTSDLKTRLQDHNAGKSRHTSKFRHVAFSNWANAASFERYLKSGSGHAFANKRLW
jgi:predicted GIY-YIG superfamily endonuclease